MPDDEYIRKELARLADAYSSLARDFNQLDEKFLPRREWIESRKADQAAVANLNQDIGALQADRRSDAAWRRQQNLTLAALAISSLVSIVLTVITLLTR